MSITQLFFKSFFFLLSICFAMTLAAYLWMRGISTNTLFLNVVCKVFARITLFNTLSVKTVQSFYLR